MNLIRMAFVGDINGGDSFSLAGRGTSAMIDRYEGRFVDPAIVDCLRSHDLVMGNIECVLSEKGRRENSLRRLHMRGRSTTCGLLAQWGITAANTANNHILEQGRASAIDTVANLKKAGITVVGAGKNESFEPGFQFAAVRLRDAEFYLGGICLRNERYAFDGGGAVEEVISAVNALQNKHAFIILAIHWGNEYIDYPSLQQRRLAKRLTEAGVNLVIGHHPHVVQGVDWYNNALVAYSLGNFIFDGYAQKTGWSFILSVTIENGSIGNVETIPVERSTDFRPLLAVEAARERYLLEIERRNALCRARVDDPVAYEREYEREVLRLSHDSRRMLWRSLARRFFGFRPVFWPQLLLRPVQRRLGVW